MARQERSERVHRPRALHERARQAVAVQMWEAYPHAAATSLSGAIPVQGPVHERRRRSERDPDRGVLFAPANSSAGSQFMG